MTVQLAALAPAAAKPQNKLKPSGCLQGAPPGAPGDDPLFASACHWYHRLGLFFNRIPFEQQQQQQQQLQKQQQQQQHQKEQHQKSRGQLRRERQGVRYDLAAMLPSMAQAEAAAAKEKQQQRQQHHHHQQHHANKKARQQQQQQYGGPATREELLRRLHAKIDALKQQSGPKKKNPKDAADPPKKQQQRQQKKRKEPGEQQQQATAKKAKGDKAPAAAAVEQDEGEFFFSALGERGGIPQSLKHGKKGAKQQRISKALKEIEAKKDRLAAAQAEGRGAEVALQEAAEIALKRISGDKIYDDARRLKKAQKQMRRKKEKSREAWAGGTYTDLQKEKKKRERAQKKRERKEVNRKSKEQQTANTED